MLIVVHEYGYIIYVDIHKCYYSQFLKQTAGVNFDNDLQIMQTIFFFAIVQPFGTFNLALR